MVGDHRHHAVVGDEGEPPGPSRALTACSPSSSVPLMAYSVQRTSPPMYTENSSMQAGMGCWATANIEAWMAWEWITTAMSS